MEMSDQIHVPAALLPWKQTPVNVVQETRWASGPGRTARRRDKSLAPTGNHTSYPNYCIFPFFVLSFSQVKREYLYLCNIGW
jgi:hypothetical protein